MFCRRNGLLAIFCQRLERLILVPAAQDDFGGSGEIAIVQKAAQVLLAEKKSGRPVPPAHHVIEVPLPGRAGFGVVS
jgi:hypothetical protein